MNFLPEKKYGVPSHKFVKKNVLWEKGDEITRFDGNVVNIQNKWDHYSYTVNNTLSTVYFRI